LLTQIKRITPPLEELIKKNKLKVNRKEIINIFRCSFLIYLSTGNISLLKSNPTTKRDIEEKVSNLIKNINLSNIIGIQTKDLLVICKGKLFFSHDKIKKTSTIDKYIYLK
jgi:hypothetical protein